MIQPEFHRPLAPGPEVVLAWVVQDGEHFLPEPSCVTRLRKAVEHIGQDGEIRVGRHYRDARLLAIPCDNPSPRL